MDQFLAHAALDMAEEKAKLSNSMVLKEVDQFNDTKVSALCTANNAKIVLLHGAQLEEQNIRHFLMEVYELYLKVRPAADTHPLGHAEPLLCRDWAHTMPWVRGTCHGGCKAPSDALTCTLPQHNDPAMDK